MLSNAKDSKVFFKGTGHSDYLQDGHDLTTMQKTH